MRVVDGSGTNKLAYDHAGRLTLSTNVDGLLAGVAVSNHLNGLNGRDSLRVLGVSPWIDQRFGYDWSTTVIIPQ